MADRGRQLAIAYRTRDRKAADEAGRTIEQLGQARKRWWDYYHSDEFADFVTTTWVSHISEHAETWRKENRESLQAARSKWRDIHRSWEACTSAQRGFRTQIMDTVYAATTKVMDDVVKPLLAPASRDPKAKWLRRNQFQVGNDPPFTVADTQSEVLQAAIELGGAFSGKQLANR